MYWYSHREIRKDECGIDINVSYDDEKKAWVVDLVKDAHELKHYLDLPEADNSN